MNRPIKVNVHLFYGADPSKYRKGENAGCLYGYHFAESERYHLTYSHDAKEGKLRQVFRRALKAVAGFDILHAWHNRKDIQQADVVWTHTEFEYLAISLLFRLTDTGSRPLLLGQSVWLFDRWSRYSSLRKAFYRMLIRRVDMLTTHSPINQKLCLDYLGRPAQLAFYGISTQDFPIQNLAAWQPHTPLHVAAIGNDWDRDWDTLVSAFDGDSRFSVRLATRRKVKSPPKAENVKIGPVFGMDAQRELYAWADIIVVPLHENKHVSGITVIFEGVTCGKPVVATQVGGLEAYFAADEITYVPPNDAGALRDAVVGLIEDPAAALQKTLLATQRLMRSAYTTENFARQHVIFTEQLLLERGLEEDGTHPGVGQ
ncbi:MAG: glycosyltransferase [Janthinobacterium lividum]